MFQDSGHSSALISVAVPGNKYTEAVALLIELGELDLILPLSISWQLI